MSDSLYLFLFLTMIYMVEYKCISLGESFRMLTPTSDEGERAQKHIISAKVPLCVEDITRVAVFLHKSPIFDVLGNNLCTN